MNDPKVVFLGKISEIWSREYTKLEQDALLAGTGEEKQFTKCFDDITGKELL